MSIPAKYKHILGIDLETYSDVDIGSAGLYKYAEHSEILLFAYAWDDNPVQIVDIFNDEFVPIEVLESLTDPTILKTAYNASFERNILKNWTDCNMPAQQWFCTMVQGLTLGLPAGLDKLGKVLNLAEDKAKMKEGKRLIQYFCKPCRPTKINGGRTRNLPMHSPDDWEVFKSYCKRDVEAERAIRKKLERYFPIETERRLWFLDQKINDAGVEVDLQMVDSALTIDERLREEWMKEAKELTGVPNPNSRKQILDWIEGRLGWQPETFDKAARNEMLTMDDIPEDVKRVITLKNWLGKTSIKKYLAMKKAVCHDGRVRGMLQFYGANRTGRWAGRVVQLHNLPQNHLEDLDGDRKLVMEGDYDTLSMLYENPADVLSQLIRTAFVAGYNKRFIVADFSAIEARVIAWLADEKWRMEVFAKGGDIYCASASQMFKVPVVKHGVNGHLRQKGKVAELACGYGGGVNALRAFGADKMGMTESEMTATIKQWRESSPHICQLWRDIETCAKKAIRHKSTVEYKKCIRFVYQSKMLFIYLPSGRPIVYVKPRIKYEDDFGKESLVYDGVGDSSTMCEVYTWGGKLVENIVQAIARDCLAVAMLKIYRAGYKIVMHVHDEVILEEPYGVGTLEKVCSIMGSPISWAPGLVLRADGYETPYYKKD